MQDFTISMVFSGPVLPAYKAAFNAAAQTWQALIPGFAAGVIPKPLVINASFPFIDGPGGVLGQVWATPIAVLYLYI